MNLYITGTNDFLSFIQELGIQASRLSNVSVLGYFYVLGDIWQCLETFWIVTIPCGSEFLLASNV